MDDAYKEPMTKNSPARVQQVLFCSGHTGTDQPSTEGLGGHTPQDMLGDMKSTREPVG